MKNAKPYRLAKGEEDYNTLDQLDGSHPWRTQVPEGSILYPVRRLSGGKVSYFNFELAKEMGIIPKDHPHKMNKKLEAKVLETFAIRIINEYDVQKKIRYSKNAIKPTQFMATRYLQLQHSDKTGRTSGDGRCIWNGVFKSKNGRSWDVSSRGTGVTALAPGAVTAGEPLRSGNYDHGYGCGMAEIDELFGAAIMAEIFHRNGITTERVLTVIDMGRGIGIGVRAAPNLLRPAHLFMYLKQGKLEPLKRSMDYLIERQYENGSWKIKPSDKDRYVKALSEVGRSFAQFVAQLERDYIFAWLDWDGDNVLAEAGVIDYGSIRQFGLRHDQYRYDDIERMSTNLNEQRVKSRETVQTFVQLVDFLQTGVRKPWKTFSSHPVLKEFDRQFRAHCLDRFLYQAGFAEPMRRLLINKHRMHVESFYRLHTQLESVKTHRKLCKVADGVHRPAILNMRKALAMMPAHLSKCAFGRWNPMKEKEFFQEVLSSQAAVKDRKMKPRVARQIDRWQKLYIGLMKKISTPTGWAKSIDLMKSRSEKINHQSRITGNALIHIVDQILRHRRRGLTEAEVQGAIDDLIAAQTLNPDFAPVKPAKNESPKPVKPQSIMRHFLSVVHDYREDI